MRPSNSLVAEKHAKISGITINYIHPGVVSTTIAERSNTVVNSLARINIDVFGRVSSHNHWNSWIYPSVKDFRLSISTFQSTTESTLHWLPREGIFERNEIQRTPWSRRLSLLWSQTAEEGAQTVLHLCLDPIGGEVTGKMWAECKTLTMLRAREPENNRRLLEVTRDCLGLRARRH